MEQNPLFSFYKNNMEKIDNTKFYEAMNLYYKTDDKKYKDVMFLEVNHICQGIIRKMSNRCRGTYSKQDLDDFAIDATCKVMEKILKKRVVVKNITNYCWLWCKAMFTTYPLLKQSKFESEVIYTDFSNKLYENNTADNQLFDFSE